MSIEVLTPVHTGEVELAKGSNRFRKQILPNRPVEYHGRTLNFSKPYFDNLVSAYKNKAFPQVPFQLSDADGGHTNDPERTRGELIDLEATNDGLYGVFELSDSGAQVVQNNPKLGVSARIIEGLDREGTQYPVALQHVLGTVDPHVGDMSGWETVDLSADTSVSQTIDLVSSHFQEEEMPKKNGTEEGTGSEGTGSETVTLELSREEHEALTEMLSDYKTAVEAAEHVDLGGGTGSKKKESEGKQHEAVELAGKQDPQVVELSNQVASLSQELNESQLTAELEQMKQYGIAPAIIEAARPLLEVSQTIELARGKKVDVGGQTRRLLSTVIKLARKNEAYVDLDEESGKYEGSDAEQSRRKDMLKAWENQDS